METGVSLITGCHGNPEKLPYWHIAKIWNVFIKITQKLFLPDESRENLSFREILNKFLDFGQYLINYQL